MRHTFFTRRCSLFAPCLLLLSTALAQPHAGRHSFGRQQPSGPRKSITLTPEVVESGSPELIRVEAPDASAVEGQWRGHPVLFFPAADHRVWYALAGVDVETSPGRSELKVTVHLNGEAHELTAPIQIKPAHYRTESLSVSSKFVEPDPEALKQINTESELKKKIFAASADHPLWTQGFRAPVKAPPTDSFGTRRMFNGKLASIHKGMDFRAPSGTPVLAGNAGKVILAQPLYYEGGCVIIDHGLGLMSLSMHMSRIDVKVGDVVSRSQRLGLSGATGRVTGPHLHWAIRWQGAMLDPAKLLRLNLDNLREAPSQPTAKPARPQADRP
jgi:murein DD-endopeptidase MepM/ murein hydrolase activator NlpD